MKIQALEAPTYMQVILQPLEMESFHFKEEAFPCGNVALEKPAELV